MDTHTFSKIENYMLLLDEKNEQMEQIETKMSMEYEELKRKHEYLINNENITRNYERLTDFQNRFNLVRKK
ncbi:hypothetical protein [Pontibacillus litoralis]|uniref:Uncharacterized protein n=1 Tax=Pontibacillus litoralis JSM 072002 TaxID=1385512 RepID=A0A0A5FZV9_9BACI|nr:hypothetical protein [Pontibacillus litoralis]KGX84368.1 hypothetical protein N784_13610 [Pontibacillus litoralis JSM 072002]